MAEKILSICIPTYNRADILDCTLSHLVNETAFLEGKVEICISNNASTDHTEEVVMKYIAQFNDGIIYHKNKKNTEIIDGNFPIVAQLASGTFIKFLNDYAYFRPEELDKMINLIEQSIEKKELLFFSNGNIIENNNEFIFCNNFNEFVSNASYWTTWVLCAGFWKEDFDKIQNRDRFIDKFMWCPDNYFKLVYSGRKTIIYNKSFCEIQNLKSKGGYNPFFVFGINYLSLYMEYLDNHMLNKNIYKKEKYKLFRHYLLNLYYLYVIAKSKDNFSFNNTNAFKNLLVNYKFNLYFYLGIGYKYIYYQFTKIYKLFFKF